jgi:FkbM family methyltransferase
MVGLISAINNFGPLQGPLSEVTRITGSTDLETRVLQILKVPYVRSRYGVKLRTNWSDATFYFCMYGEYGRALADLLEGKSRPFVFLDIGANQGLYSLIAGTNPYCRAALAFEPVPATFAMLEANIRGNRVSDKVRAVNRAIAAKNGSTVIRVAQGHSGGASMACANDVDGKEVTIHMIDHVAMDEMIPEGVEPIVVKIDVEGFEPVVVGELVQSRHRDRISMLFYEIDEQWVDPKPIEQTLRGIGFTTFQKVSKDPNATHYDVLATR